MVVYEVNLEVQSEIDEDWRAWIRPHMAELIALEGFQGAELYEVEQESESKSRHYSVQYQVENRASLDAYFKAHAPRLRQEGLERFGERFTASRRIYRKL